MSSKLKLILIFIIGAICGIGAMSVFNSKETKSTDATIKTTFHPGSNSIDVNENNKNNALEIDDLTSEKLVVDYLKANQKLPDYYITKNEARNSGWVASKGNLCDVLQGKAIGGDKFSNREKKLPINKGRQYYEADLNYNCGRRNADRVVYSNDGLIFVTKDHYKTFEEQ